MKPRIILLIILLLSLSLNIVGITWGLPDRWNVDESVAAVLKMAYERKITPENDIWHPTFYYFFLGIFLGLFILFLKIVGYPLGLVVSSAAVSWINFANSDPFLASSLYIIARMLSAILGVATVSIVYLIAGKIYSKKVGLFSALTLALSIGFIVDSHYAKSSSLISFLSVLTVYFCIKAAYNGNFKRHFLIASFLGGLSLATKFNGGILLSPLIITYFYNYTTNHPLNHRSPMHFLKYIKILLGSKILMSAIGIYILGFFIGFPGFFLNFMKYLPGLIFYEKNYFVGYLPPGLRILDFLKSMGLYLYRLIDVYGIFLFLIVFAGLVTTVKDKNQGKKIILSVVIPYFIIISSIQMTMQPIAKYIILIVPFLAIFAGFFLNKLAESKRIPNGIKYLLFLLLLFFSFRHIVYTEGIFLKNDIRYLATEWIDKNIPSGASIEVFSELDWYFSSRLLKKYNLVFFGTNSDNTANRSQFKIWTEQEKIKDYFKELNIGGPQSDYLVISSVDFADTIIKNFRQKERALFLDNLIKGKWSYRMIKKISYDPEPVFSHIIDYTPIYILVFRK